MKQFKSMNGLRLLAGGLLWLLALGALAAQIQIGDLYYYFYAEGEAATVTSKSSGDYSGDIVIPESVTYNGTTYAVTGIYYSAFSGCTGLTSIEISNSVTEIGSSAFSGCTGLTEVTIPNSVTEIGSSAFSGCTGLTEVTIPNSVTFIGRGAFKGCTGLMAINVDESNTKYSSVDGVLYNKAKTSLLQWPGGKMEVNIPSSVTSIVDYAFAGCTGLTSIEIPASVDTVDSYAFEGCTGLTHVTIADRRTAFKSFGSSVFASCSIRILYLGSNVNYYRSEYWRSPFRNLTTLETVTIGPLVTDIGYYSPFGSCTGLTAIDVNESNTKYSSVDGVLYNKDKTWLLQWPGGKTEVEIPSSVTLIYFGAFDGCTGLTSIEIPASVDTVARLAFTGCTGLQSVKIADRETTLKFGYSVFHGTVKEGKFYNISQCPIRNLYVGGNISYDVTDVSFCYDCGPRFLFDSVLESVTFGQMVTTIGDYAFAGCSGLTSIDIPNSVKEIGSYAFSGCTGLQTVVLGKSLTHIREKSFWGCEHLMSLTSKANVPAECAADAFESVPAMCELIVPEASVELYKIAPVWKDFLRVTGQDLSDRIYVTALRLEPDGASLRVGTGLQLRAVVTPDSATEQTVVWSSSDKNVLRVDNDGYVMAVAAGEAVVTARTTDGSNLSATCNLKVVGGSGGGNTAVEVLDALQAVRVYADGGRIEVRGLPLGTAVTLSGVDGRLWYRTEAVTGSELTLSAPRGHVYVIRLNHTHSLKVYLP